MRELLLTVSLVAIAAPATALPAGHAQWYILENGECNWTPENPRAFYARLEGDHSYSDVRLTRPVEDPTWQHAQARITAAKGGVTQHWDLFNNLGDCKHAAN